MSEALELQVSTNESIGTEQETTFKSDEEIKVADDDTSAEFIRLPYELEQKTKEEIAEELYDYDPRDSNPYDDIPENITLQRLCMILIECPLSTSTISINGVNRTDIGQFCQHKYLRFICAASDVDKIKSITIDGTDIELKNIQNDKKWSIPTSDDIPEQIEEQKYCKYNEDIIIYYEIIKDCMTMRIDSNLAPEDDEYLNVFQLTKGFKTDENEWSLLWEKNRENYYEWNGGFPLWAMTNFRTAQFYHDPANQIIFILPYDTAAKSIAINAIADDNQMKPENEDETDDDGDRFEAGGRYLKYTGPIRNGFMSLSEAVYHGSIGEHRYMFGPQYYRNITYQTLLAERYWWLKEKCLYGQDNEYNIFRSLCFTETANDQSKVARLSIGILCLMLQAILTVGIVIEVIDNWDIDEMFDSDYMIIAISFMVFAFISLTYENTVLKYREFYGNMVWIAKVLPWIKYFDFMSNIAIGFVICLVSFAYLLQSETIGDVVLNSFALTFILELDDLANVFDSDERVLITSDWYNLTEIDEEEFSDWCVGEFRRRITISWRVLLKSFGYCLLSPIFMIYALIQIILGFKDEFKVRKVIEPSFMDIKQKYSSK